MDIKINSYKTNPMFMANTYKSLTDKMIPVLQEAIKNGETVTSEQLAQKIGAAKDVVRHILYHEKDSLARNLFNQVKSSKGSKKIVSDKTIADYGVAMTAAAIAGISLRNKDTKTHVKTDYAAYLAQKVEDLKLSEEQNADIMNYLSKSPLFIDFIINNTDKNGNRRMLRSMDTKSLYRAYSMNHELTEQLAKTFDKEGNFRYSSEQINKLLYINAICPELYGEALDNPDAIYEMYNAKDENENPRFGLNDIKLLAEKYKKFPRYTKFLLAEKDISGRPRFNAEQTLFILNELEGDCPGFVVDLVRFHKNIYTEKSNYVASRPQTVKLSGDNIEDIINMNKTYNVQKFVYNLMEIVSEYNITGSSFVRCTELSTKPNIEFVKGLRCEPPFNNPYCLLDLAGRELTQKEFETLKTMESEQSPLVYAIGRKTTYPLFDDYQLKQIEPYVE